MYINYRKVNAVTKRLAYPMRNMDDILDCDDVSLRDTMPEISPRGPQKLCYLSSRSNEDKGDSAESRHGEIHDAFP